MNIAVISMIFLVVLGCVRSQTDSIDEVVKAINDSSSIVVVDQTHEYQIITFIEVRNGIKYISMKVTGDSRENVGGAIQIWIMKSEDILTKTSTRYETIGRHEGPVQPKDKVDFIWHGFYRIIE